MNINQLMQQAQAMQRKLNKVQKAFNDKEFPFESADHLIKGIMKGNMEIVQLEIDTSLLDPENKEILQDMLVLTLNGSREKIAKQKEEEIGDIAGGVSVPDLY